MKKIMFNDRYSLTESVLSGRKTQTRRVIKMTPVDERYAYKENFPMGGRVAPAVIEAYSRYQVGEVVAVAQCYKDIACGALWDDLKEAYRAEPTKLAGWTNKMFVRADLMPHRIRITNVRVQRLNDISAYDCEKEGVYEFDEDPMNPQAVVYTFPNSPMAYYSAKEAYAALIDRISGKGTWESNPWVFVYDFELVKKRQ